MKEVGAALRRAGVSTVYLVHGTFVGTDALGFLTDLCRIYPELAAWVARLGKQVSDRVSGDAGNYTGNYARRFEESINVRGEAYIPVRRFFWSSQNNHIGRADGAVRLLDEIASLGPEARGRILLWGHSHAGNVFSLITNLVAADGETLERFFSAASVYYRWPVLGCVDIPVWNRVQQVLSRHRDLLAGKALDIVTFGTPIRYGWDSDGYCKLLHFVNHHPSADLPRYRAPFPPTPERVLTAADGDYIQQLGIAGTNIMPSIFSWRSWLADNRLNDLLQPEIGGRDILDRLSAGVRVADEGTTLLVDYGPQPGSFAEHAAGHAVYTREQYLLFHAEEVARRFYRAA